MKYLEKEYLKLYYILQQQYSNYFENQHYDLNKIDEAIYKLVYQFKDKISGNDRISQIARSLIDRNLVDKRKEVTALRNKIDDLTHYEQGLIYNSRYEYKVKVARNMKQDVRLLMMRRNELANDLGYKNYKDLVFQTEESNDNKIKKLLIKFIDENLQKAKKIIDKYNISFETYFADLAKINLKFECNPQEISTNLINKLGYNKILDSLEISYQANGAGYAANLAPKKVKVVVGPIDTLSKLSTLFHELGHAFMYQLNEELGLYKIIPATLDEAMAVVVEYLAPFILLSKKQQDVIQEFTTLEYTRCAISALFELELWDDLDQAENLYVKHYSQLFEVKDPILWAYDSFRSIDPVYIHSYVLGAILANKLVNNFQNPHEYGAWLYNNIYKHGSKNSINDIFSLLKV